MICLAISALTGIPSFIGSILAHLSMSAPGGFEYREAIESSHQAAHEKVLLRQQSVSLTLEGKEKPIALLVPVEFKAPSTASELAIRSSQITAWNSNPGRNTRYSDWMVYDWKTQKKEQNMNEGDAT
jgi:hypothetical protein